MSDKVTMPYPASYYKPNMIGGVAQQQRRGEPKVTVWSPEGVKEVHIRSTARDLVRLRGYLVEDPNQPVVATPDPAAEDEKFSEREVAVNEAMAALAELRQAATKLGVEVDLRWGTKRLTEEINAAQARLSAKPETPPA